MFENQIFNRYWLRMNSVFAYGSRIIIIITAINNKSVIALTVIFNLCDFYTYYEQILKQCNLHNVIHTIPFRPRMFPSYFSLSKMEEACFQKGYLHETSDNIFINICNLF